MKKLLCLTLCLIMLVCCVPFSYASAEPEREAIKWFTAGMTVGEARELSPALKTFKRDGEYLSSNDFVATGDTVITDNAEYTAWVLGDATGDGEPSQYSYILIKRQHLDNYTPNEMEKFASDIQTDGVIDQYDYLLAKRAFFGTYEIPKPVNSDGVPVLLYHHILEDKDKNTPDWSGNEITIATSEFRRHMQMLEDGGYNVVTVSDVVAYVRGEILLPPKSLVLTFDDGYKSNTYYAAPILKEFGYKATMFAIMTLYEGEYQDWYDVSALQHVTRQDLAQYPDTIDQQCHTYANHNHLPEQSYNQIYNDLMLSQAVDLNDYFAYPYGDYNSTVIQAVKDAGFVAAFTTVERNAKPGDSVYEIPRYTITSPMKDSDYLKLIAKAD